MNTGMIDMAVKTFIVNYKGFEIEGTKITTGFNQYDVTAKIYKNKGFREEEYFHLYVNSHSPLKSEAIKQMKKEIDNLKEIPFFTNGTMNWMHLPSIKDNPEKTEKPYGQFQYGTECTYIPKITESVEKTK
jgi:hypothetical protein